MKNIFNLLNEEKTRILEMHESATKRQYLNEIGLGGEGEPDYDRNTVTSTPSTPKKSSGPKKSSYTTTQWNEMSGGGGFVYGLPKGTVFSATKDPLIVTAKSANVYKRVSGPGKKWGQEQLRVSFYCKKGKFYIQKYENVELYNTTLGNALVTYVCGYKPQPQKPKTETPQSTPLTDDQKLEKATNCGHSTWDAYQKSGWKCPGTKTNSSFVSGGGGENTPSSSSTNVSDINIQIQQLLGNQSPTGKITDADIDLILTKLG